MSVAPKLGFGPFTTPTRGILVVFCDADLKFGAATRKALAASGDLVKRAAAADRFTGKQGAVLDIVAPAGLSVARLLVVGLGKVPEMKPQTYLKLGGIVAGKIPSSATETTIMAET